MYFKLISKSYKINSKYRKFKNISICDYLSSKIANIIIPFFLILKINPNQITVLNIFFSFLAIVLVNAAGGEFFGYALIFFFICKIIDHSDGGVARISKRKTFFGKFADSINDAFLSTLFYLALSFYCFNLTDNNMLFVIGIIASVFLLMGIFILDKFSALVRWSNTENKKNFPSYIRRNKLLRFFLTLEDINFFGVFILFIYKNNLEAVQLIFGIICFSILLSATVNLIMHSLYAYQYLNFNKK
tara:strand:- start:880 stop:1614 length:735 start_codon:yes stop_codon:yes gene_type:complete